VVDRRRRLSGRVFDYVMARQGAAQPALWAVGGAYFLAELGDKTTLAPAYGLYPLVCQPWHAIVFAALAGAGIGTWLTMQSSLLAALTPASLRHMAFAWQRVAANVGLGLGGFAGGLIVTTAGHRRSPCSSG
jgi:predicted MFS family arabinose efflux permease